MISTIAVYLAGLGLSTFFFGIVWAALCMIFDWDEMPSLGFMLLGFAMMFFAALTTFVAQGLQC